MQFGIVYKENSIYKKEFMKTFAFDPYEWLYLYIIGNMFVVIGINLVFGLSMPGIDNWGHIGGLIGGAAVAYGLLPKYQRPSVTHFGAQPLMEEERATFEWLWTGGVVILLVWAVRLISANYLG